MKATEQYNIGKIEKRLQKELDEDRYRHTMGVTYISAALAMRYGADLEKAMVAGLLHDCAKCIPNDRKLKLCEKYQIPVSQVERGAPYLLHSKLGAYLAEAEYGVKDVEILQAITWHTTGKPDMTLLEKIVFLADYIEPMRWKAENLNVIRKTAFEDLDRAVYLTLRDTLHYLEKRDQGAVDEMTRDAYLHYLKLQEGKEPDENETDGEE